MLKLTIQLFLMISLVRKREVWGMVAYINAPNISAYCNEGDRLARGTIEVGGV